VPVPWLQSIHYQPYQGCARETVLVSNAPRRVLPGMNIPGTQKEKHRINVIASIRVKTGSLSEFLEIFRANISKVREEKGCIEYFPVVDIDAKLSPQILDENVVTIIESGKALTPSAMILKRLICGLSGKR